MRYALCEVEKKRLNNNIEPLFYSVNIYFQEKLTLLKNILPLSNFIKNNKYVRNWNFLNNYYGSICIITYIIEILFNKFFYRIIQK